MSWPSKQLTEGERLKHLTIERMMDHFGASRTSIWGWARDGTILKPRYLRSHRPVWLLGEVVDWSARKMKETEHSGEIGYKGKPKEERKSILSRADELRRRLGLLK